MAKKDVSAIESGMGVGMAILTSLLAKARKWGLPEGTIHRLATPEGEALLDQMVQVLAFAVGEANRLFVDYTQPLADLIKDCKFDWVNDNITEKHFLIIKHSNGEVEMKLFHFNRTISSDQAIQEMDKEGYRPAELPELLAYAKNNPDEQRKYPIVILGSVWRRFGDRRVPYLYSDSDKRDLNLYWYDNDWDSYYRFLAVRKS